MRELRSIDVREQDDEQLLREIFQACDEASRLARRSTELAISLDRLAGIAAERWAREALDKIDADERAEMAGYRS